MPRPDEQPSELLGRPVHGLRDAVSRHVPRLRPARGRCLHSRSETRLHRSPGPEVSKPDREVPRLRLGLKGQLSSVRHRGHGPPDG